MTMSPDGRGLNDNNFPSSSGRTPGKADNNEFITIRLTRDLR